MIKPFESTNPLAKRKIQKDFSLYKRFSETFKDLENFGATLKEVVHCVFH